MRIWINLGLQFEEQNKEIIKIGRVLKVIKEMSTIGRNHFKGDSPSFYLSLVNGFQAK